MATLTPLLGDRPRPPLLRAEQVVGRAPGSYVRLLAGTASASHARIWWNRGAWQVRDLGSRNGTWLNGRRLGEDERVEVSPGDLLGFGPEERWMVHDVEPPVPFAVRADGALVTGDRELLRLGREQGELVLVQYVDGQWIAHDGEDQVRSFQDLDQLAVDGHLWSLHLPSWIEATDVLASHQRDLLELNLHFQVAATEESTRLLLVGPGVEVDLGDKSRHYLLLTLARERIRDEARGLDPEAAGWMGRDILTRQLQLSGATLYAYASLAKRQLDELGIRHSELLLERRAYRQLRLGLPAARIRVEAKG